MNSYKKGSCGSLTSLAIIGYGISSAVAYLGDHLVYSVQISVDHTETSAEYSEDFIAVLNEKVWAMAKISPLCLTRSTGVSIA